jgi:hypothetical protein
MQWYSQNPHGADPGLRGSLNWGAHKLGRSLFASKFAQGGGIVAGMFSATAGDAFKNPWRQQHKYGSPQHIKNLERMQVEMPGNKGIDRALEKAKKGSSKLGMLGRTAGLGLGAAFTMLPAFLTPGSGQEKARAVVGGAAGLGGWFLGAKAGASVGGALGSVVPGLGTAVGTIIGAAVGAFAGSIAADEGFQGLSRIPDRMVERERSRRKLDWVGDKRAFQTERASTMRQQSMQMMNKGMMSARSMLGREGVMLHQ